MVLRYAQQLSPEALLCLHPIHRLTLSRSPPPPLSPLSRPPACSYVIMGDGCNMEGISSEAASIAGHWGLGKLIALYDDNRISIDGHTEISFTEDVCARYEAMGWHVQHVKDGNHDLAGLNAAIAAGLHRQALPDQGVHPDWVRLPQQGRLPRRARRAPGRR